MIMLLNAHDSNLFKNRAWVQISDETKEKHNDIMKNKKKEKEEPFHSLILTSKHARAL